MKFQLSILPLYIIFLFLKTSLTYEEIYSKNYGSVSNCFDDLPGAWQKIEGGVIASCPDSCTYSDGSTGIIRYVSDQSSTTGLLFSYTASTITQGFQFVGVDILYFQIGGSSVTLSINSINTVTISTLVSATYEEQKAISCPDARHFYKGNSLLSISSLPSNTINFKVIKDSASQSLGIRSIRVWTNCRENCDTCFDSTNCSSCFTGFRRLVLSSGEMVCEQFTGCTLSNCFSCYKGTSIEVCAKCQPGFKFDSSNSCVTISGLACPAYTYETLTSSCSAYTFNCIYQTKNTSTFVACVNQENVTLYKCLAEQMVIVYDKSNYGVWNCGCLVENCGNCNPTTSCSSCSPGYSYNSTTGECDSICIANCASCSSGVGCNSCNSGYTYNSSSSSCVANCPLGQYLNSGTCTTCPDGNCLDCSSATVCTTCASGFTYSSTDSRCNRNCTANQYYVSSSNTCVTCPDSNCLSCSSATVCTTCASGFTYSSTDSRCNRNCIAGQYYSQSSNTCPTCPDINCQACSSATVCTTCASGFTYSSSDSRCNRNCIVGQYYAQSSNTCPTCPDTNCQACSSATVCTICASGFTYSSTDSRCNINCTLGQYFIFSSNTCASCSDLNCLDCYSATICTTCASGYTYSSTHSRCDLNCNSNQYLVLSSNSCSNCGLNCLTCSSSQCTTCTSTLFMDEQNQQNCVSCTVSNCQQCLNTAQNCGACNPGYALTSTFKCEIASSQAIYIALDSQQIEDNGYILKVSFQPNININGIGLDKLLVINITNKSDFTYSVTELTQQQAIISIKTQSNIKNQQVTITFTNQLLLSQNNLSKSQIKEELKAYVLIPQEQKQAAQTMTTVGKNVSTVIITSMLPIVILSNFYILVNTIDITGFLYYMLFINIRHPDNVVQFYSIFKNFQFPFIPNFFEGVVRADYIQKSPPKFMENSTDLYFLKNVGQTITIWGAIFGVYIVAKIGTKLPIPHLQSYLKIAVDRTWEWGSFFDLIWNTYIYALVGVFLQFRSFDFSDSTYLVNYILFSLCTVLVLVIPVFTWWLIFREKDMKNSHDFKTRFNALISGISVGLNIEEGKEEKYDIDEKQIKLNIQGQHQQDQNPFSQDSLIPNIKNNNQSQLSSESLLNQQKKMKNQIKLHQQFAKYFYPVLYFRKIIFGLFIVYPTEQVYLQLSSLIGLNIFIISYFLICKPYESKHENIKTIVGEFVLIGIAFSAFFLVEDKEDENENKRLNIGWVIVGLSATILSWHTTQLLIETIKSILNLIKEIIQKLRRGSKVSPINMQQMKGEQQVKKSQEQKKDSINESDKGTHTNLKVFKTDKKQNSNVILKENANKKEKLKIKEEQINNGKMRGKVVPVDVFIDTDISTAAQNPRDHSPPHESKSQIQNPMQKEIRRKRDIFKNSFQTDENLKKFLSNNRIQVTKSSRNVKNKDEDILENI